MTESQHRHVSVDGLECDVDMARFSSWRATKMLAATAAAKDDQTKAAAFIAYLDYALGDAMPAIEEAAGGEEASTEAVLGLATKVLAEVSKNS